MHFTGHVGRGRGMIDEHSAFFHTRINTVRAQGYLTQIIIGADTGEDDAGATGGRLWRPGAGPAMFRHPGLGPGAVPIKNGDIMTLGGQMPGHGVAHDAQPYKGDLFTHAVLHI